MNEIQQAIERLTALYEVEKGSYGRNSGKGRFGYEVL